jgi:hypothetical protein
LSEESTSRQEILARSMPRLPEFAEIDDLRSDLLRSSLHASSSIDDIVALCLDRFRSIMPFELVSVYLLNRLGKLHRVGVRSAQGGPIPEVRAFGRDEWGQLLPGWTLGSRRSDLLVRSELSPDDPMAAWITEKVGQVTGIIRVPLTGSSQTFGFLEAVNPSPRQTQWGPEIEFRRDVRRLVFIGSALACAMTTWRARNEMFAVGAVMTFLAGSNLHAGADEEELSNVFTAALNIGLDHLHDYRAAILRIENPSDSLAILARAKNADLSWEGWRDRELRAGHFLAEQVLESLKPITVEPIESNPQMFANYEWLQRVGIRCAACVPMQITDWI